MVDPAGLHYITSTPSGAGGASGALYKHLNMTAFGPEVKAALTQVGQAVYTKVGGQPVIFSTPPPLRNITDRKVVTDLLTEVYEAVLKAALPQVPTGSTVRIPIMSGGNFAGSWKTHIPSLTSVALADAIQRVGFEAVRDSGLTFHLCTYTQSEVVALASEMGVKVVD